MIVYFSGTGNSCYVAQMLAQQLSDELFDVGQAIKKGESPVLSSRKPWVFVSPTYGWRIPRIFQQFVEKTTFSGDKNAYFVMTCGTEIGNAAKYIRPLCAEKGFVFRGVLQVVMPENYLAMFDVPNAKRAAAIIRMARPTIRSGGDVVLQGKDFPERALSVVDRLKSTVVNPAFYSLIVHDKKFYTTDACVGCGQCAEVCPLHNIVLTEGRPRWQGNCTHCMACICSCPTEAIEYGKKSVGQPRYQCPKFEKEEG